MPHILRAADGRITSLLREPVEGSEFLPGEAAELQQFLIETHAGAAGTDFAVLDAGLIRVIEDLVDLLVARNLIRITDLPPEAQHKLFARKNLRDRLQHRPLDLGVVPADQDGGLHFPPVDELPR